MDWDVVVVVVVVVGVVLGGDGGAFAVVGAGPEEVVEELIVSLSVFLFLVGEKVIGKVCWSVGLKS